MQTSQLHKLFYQPMRGAMPDIDPMVVPDDAATMLINFVRDGNVIRVRDGLELFGHTQSGASTERISGIFRLSNEDIDTILAVVTDMAIYKYDDNTSTFQSLMPTGVTLNGNDIAQPQARVFFKENGTRLIFVNGVDTPKVLDPNATTVRDLLGSPPNAECIAVSANRVLLSQGYTIYVSSFNECDAGYQTEQLVVLADTPGKIMLMLERGNLTTLIFKEDAIYECVATGGPYPFEFRLRTANTVGLASSNSVVPLPDGNFLFLGRDGSVYLYDGVNIQFISSAARAYLASKLDRSKMYRSFAYWDLNLNAAVFFGPDPADGYCKNGVILTYPDFYVFPVALPFPVTVGTSIFVPQSPVWEDFDIPWGPDSAWETIGGDYIRTMFGTQAGDVFAATGVTDNNQPVHAEIVTKALPFADNVPFITVSGAELFISGGPANVTAQLYTTDYGEAELLYDEGPLPLIGSGPMALGFRASCRSGYVRFLIDSTGPVKYRGAAVSLAPRGQR